MDTLIFYEVLAAREALTTTRRITRPAFMDSRRDNEFTGDR